MKKVATRNWGPEFRELSNLIGLKSVSTRANEQALRDEIARGDGSHGYGRHGAQTGWEAQFIRAVTKITPDQAHDPMGVNGTLRRWNGFMSYSDVNGAPVLDLFDQNGHDPTNFVVRAGDVSGGFITPEAQFLAKARGMQVLGQLRGPAFYAARYRFKTERKFIHAPINSVHVVVGPARAGGLYGLGFARRRGVTYSASRDFVLKMIDALLTGKKGSAIGLPPGDPMAAKLQSWIGAHAARPQFVEKPLFADMGELADFFEIDIKWQKSCSLIFRRDHFPASHSHGVWRLITMFPNDLDPGWAPSLFLTDAMKDALIAARNGFNRNAADYHWTGQTLSFDGASKQTSAVPAWGG